MGAVLERRRLRDRNGSWTARGRGRVRRGVGGNSGVVRREEVRAEAAGAELAGPKHSAQGTG